MVQFHEHIISDLLEEEPNSKNNGGLVILSSGLALHKLISSLLTLHSSSQGTLLILNSNPSQRSSIIQSLELQNFSNLPLEITSELSQNHRHSLYTSSSAFFITSRILIVDLLNSKVPTSLIAGIIILNAHNLTETCTESFIVRIFRGLNKVAYVRAFSDKPNGMVSGFGKTQRIMKCLFMRKLHLWPRFQVYVSQDLEKDPPVVIDVRVGMSGYMKGIQKAVIEAMDACLKELKKSNKVDVDDLTVENSLFKSFDEIVRRQLDPIWHVLGKKTKQLVMDLKTLRKLLDYLVRYDAVTYLKYLDTLRVSEGVRSIWIFADSSHKIFEFAKKRVYRLVQANGEKLTVPNKSVGNKKKKAKEDNSNEKEETNTTSGVVIEEVLEEAPKWKVLREILEEIEEERQKQAMPQEGKDITDYADDDNGIVLVACKDERSCMQLEDFVTKGARQVMRDEWEKYLRDKTGLHGLQARQGKKPRNPKGVGILDGKVPVMSRENVGASSVSKLEHDALLAAASCIKNLSKDETVAIGDDPQPQGGSKGRGKGKGKGKSKESQGNTKVSPSKEISTRITRKRKSTMSNVDNESGRSESNTVDSEVSREETEKSGTVNKGALRIHEEEVNAAEFAHVKPLPIVHFFALDSDQHILDILKPTRIIVYHPDMTFVREVEVYKAENPLMKLKIYFLFYEDSTEVQKFEASIRRENSAFESLIRQKSLMMFPLDQDGHCVGPTTSIEPQGLTSQNSLTRKAGGRKEAEKVMQVIVDMREFMSSLPNVLHQKGLQIIPVTLDVGDYVLSPLICVERKSISDLFQSFASGRLYTQVETMVRYYRMPVLLIEFSQDKSFSFQSASDIGDDVTPTSIISKLSLLVMHFPRLRLVWSRNLYATAEIFASLKSNQDEPDLEKAMRVGVPSEEGIIADDVRAETYNTSAVEFLRRLPGVTDSNYRALIDGCKSLAELALLPIDKLAELMGGQKAARTLRDFLDAKFPTMP
ncbi:hypothetical protein C5167_041044 [Papaver somniferum]|uniref:ERCC4 domain-containing protein n=1 Tax=Papaver somniferum TaxID=3469 RepID=A0A4Y7IK58_PAPSO|nr:DNA repair endonuclease UVH1-like [Papaver somniferum]RZC48111.1 hypothetical protein C5167_041044 [Papaver somniferum]